jgi:hypothetical protein|uniref:Uncharacterized protein n=1 Tax=viral metagenome TaxID=1070528 RepID=A0A6C0JCV3_9ZZZZ
MELNKSDYRKIMKYYGLKIPRNNKTLKQNAESVLADKLCKCIKKVNKLRKTRSVNSKRMVTRSMTRKNNSNQLRASVGICKNSVLTKKQLNINRFSCKAKARLYNFPDKKYAIKLIDE